MYVTPTLVEFYTRVRDVAFSRNVFEVVENGRLDNWYMWHVISFLVESGYAKIDKKGKLTLTSELLSSVLVERKNVDDVKKIIQKTLKVRIKNFLRKPSIQALKKIRPRNFEFKPHYDQWPISLESVITLILKILEHYPFKSNFLFIGDDDFASVFLSIVEPRFSSIVVDIDDELLSTIDEFSSSLELQIQTKKMDVLKVKRLKKLIFGFCTNPPYTLEGVKSFVGAGLKFFGKDGGRVFLELGDEIMGTRYLFMQKFFVEKRLLIREVARGVVHYPFMLIHENDQRIFEKLKQVMDEKTIKAHYQINGDLWVLDYIPWNVRLMKVKGMKIYSYL
ncbi:MAG: bis-aminopropyl spermidine synthase family protein [Candidatus Aenigmarchaeota archaeon]|nr:bis-aminopropyl spermidine synthase family protein [Candidatus Aenigmarchaeota archaeon]